MSLWKCRRLTDKRRGVNFRCMTKSARLDLRVRPELKEALQRLADRDRRRLADYVDVVLTDHAMEEGELKRPGDRRK